jgi:hypothetical protein
VLPLRPVATHKAEHMIPTILTSTPTKLGTNGSGTLRRKRGCPKGYVLSFCSSCSSRAFYGSDVI